jgi:hypothetical protein
VLLNLTPLQKMAAASTLSQQQPGTG